ncbi:MAG: ABC transporter ATP-binding protein [Tepidisphaeraceae bacterium]
MSTNVDDPALSLEQIRQTAVYCRDLSKVYKDFWGRDKVRALEGLNLTIQRGEVFGLLGPNGSGKSTTIKLLLGLIFPTAGDAYVLGQPTDAPEVKAKVGFLPEESYLYRFLNGEETLWFYGELFKIPRKVLKTRVPELLDTVGLDAKARQRKIREYSKGMARRIGLAQALINDPELVLLDEPTTGLDPIGTREMKDSHPLAQRSGQDRHPLLAPAGRRAGRVRPHHHPLPRQTADAGRREGPLHGQGT